MDRGLGPGPSSRLTETSSSFQSGSTVQMVPTLACFPPEQTLVDTLASAYLIWRLVMHEDGGLDAADRVSHCSGVRGCIRSQSIMGNLGVF